MVFSMVLCVRVCMYMCVRVCMYMCVHVCMYMCVCSGWKCAHCDLTSNLWMNLTDGTIVCGRKYFDGRQFDLYFTLVKGQF